MGAASQELTERAKLLISERRYQDAVRACRRALLSQPGQIEIRLLLGEALLALERYDEAMQMINIGMRYGLSVRSRILLQLAQARVHLAQGDSERAQSVMLDIRALMRAMPTRLPGVEKSVEELQDKIDSAG